MFNVACELSTHGPVNLVALVVVMSSNGQCNQYVSNSAGLYDAQFVVSRVRCIHNFTIIVYGLLQVKPDKYPSILYIIIKMATVPNLTNQDFISANHANLIRTRIQTLLNRTNADSYGVSPLSTAASAEIQLATADHWSRLYQDVNNCYRHRTGVNIPGVTAPSNSATITAATLNAIYNAADASVNDRYAVAASQLEANTDDLLFTPGVAWDNAAAYAYTWSWDTELEAGWHFNLGGYHAFQLTASAGTGSAADQALQQAVTAAASVISQPYTRSNWNAGSLVTRAHTTNTPVGEISITVTYSKDANNKTLVGSITVITPASVTFNSQLTGNFKYWRSHDAISAARPVTDELTRVLGVSEDSASLSLPAGSRSGLVPLTLSNASPSESITITGITATNSGATGFVVSEYTDFVTSNTIDPINFPLTIAAQQSVTIKVFYVRAVESTEGIGTFSNSLQISSNSDIPVSAIPISVTVTAPAFDFSLDLVDYDQPYTYAEWESNATRQQLGINIANRFYLSNTNFGVISGFRRYGLYKKPNLADLDYWTTICAVNYGSNYSGTAFTELFFNSISPSSSEFSRMLTGNKTFDAGWGYGNFYDQSLIDVDVGTGSNKLYKYYIRPEFGAVLSYTSSLSNYQFNDSPISGSSSAARSFYVDNNMGSSLPPSVTNSPITTNMNDSSPLDGPRVRFDPFDVLSTGSYTATLSVAVTARNLAGQTVTVTRTSTVTVNVTFVTDGNLLQWTSALNRNNGIMGISYDRINGESYLTVGVGSGADNSADVANGGYAMVSVNSLGVSGDTGFQNGLPLYKMNSVSGWSSFMNQYGVWPVNPPPASTAAAADFTVCISVIDEADDGGSLTEVFNRWAAFRAKYPYRPFYLLVANSGYGGMRIPSNFDSDPNAYKMLVSRSGSNVGSRDDWFAMCNLSTVLAGTRVLLAIDNSGSMRTSTVRASYDYFIQRVTAAGLPYNVTEMGEDWITPQDAYAVSITPQDPYIFDYDNSYTFNVPADGTYNLQFQGTANGKLYIDGVARLTATGTNNGAVTGSVNLTAGAHRVAFKISNIRNDLLGRPNGVAIVITRPSTGSVVWSTLTPVRLNPPYIRWAEVYRFPIKYGVSSQLKSRDYVIKHSRPMSNINGLRYTDYFGTPGTTNSGSLLVVDHDGYGNLQFYWNTVGTLTGDAYHDTTLYGITELPYYFSFSSNRIETSNLETLLPQQKTHKLVGVNPIEPVLAITDAPGVRAPRTYTVPGKYIVTAPTGATSMAVEVAGAAGGGGGADRQQGGNGVPGSLLSGTISVSGGNVLELYVGAGGGPGTDGSNATGGYGGFGYRSTSGGNGGNSGPGGTSGSGGGGGGSSGIYNATINANLVVASGGGGGGGGGKRTPGTSSFQSTPEPGSNANGWNGGNGSTHTGDGGGGGGGGAGYPGGVGGGREYGDYGGYAGQTGISSGATYISQYGTGGIAQIRGSRAATAGTHGYVKITFNY